MSHKTLWVYTEKYTFIFLCIIKSRYVEKVDLFSKEWKHDVMLSMYIMYVFLKSLLQSEFIIYYRLIFLHESHSLTSCYL